MKNKNITPTTETPSQKETKSQNTDQVNLSQVKVKLGKNKDLITKEGRSTSSKEIYRNTETLSIEEKKKFRGKIRRNLKNFVNTILGKDRSDSERETGIKEFVEFYKKNWKLNDFKVENFTLTQNETDRKDYANLLKFVKDSLE